jgi:dolichol-phosphate mannosyltransferase
VNEQVGGRWLKFNAVGGIGIAVQLAVLAALKSGLGLNYLLATVLAVEAAVLHNFLWHRSWTWKGRRAGWTELARFNLTTGALSILSNVVFMHVLVWRFGVPYLPANLMSIALTSVANFLLAELFVFRPTPSDGAPAASPRV